LFIRAIGAFPRFLGGGIPTRLTLFPAFFRGGKTVMSV
jgi:hypothetical protein